MTLVVRPLGPDDWKVLRQLRLHALELEPGAYGSTYSLEFTRDPGEWRSVAGMFAWFCVEDDGEPVAIAAGVNGTTRPTVSARLEAMWVEPKWRGTDAAKVLLEAVKRWALASGSTHLVLDVADGNERAHAFYQRAGFVPTGRTSPLHSDPTRRCRELRLEL